MFAVTMDLAQAQAHLTRITRLFDDLTANPEQVSSLERDLLKEYVRRLYESLSTDATNLVSKPRVAARDVQPVAVAPLAPEPVVERRVESPKPKASTPVAAPRPSFSFDSDLPAKPTPAPKPAPKPAPPKPAVIEIPAEVEADVQHLERQSATTPTTTKSIPVVEVPVQESPFAPEPSELSPALKNLFSIEQGTDLSDRLAGTKVSDLTRSLALNDRIEFQNTLFGGYKQEFDQALQHLNGLPDFEAAVSFLGGGAAKKFDWLDDQRQSAAQAFIKQVRRRYV